MTYVAGRVAVPVVPDLRGFQKTIARQGAKGGDGYSQQFGKQTKKSKLGGFVTKSLKTGLKVGGVAAAVTAGFAIKGGITRLMGIEDARASLKGLGHSAKAVDKIMGNALDAVKGTAFGMADAAKIAASSVAAGIKPGKELTAHLKNVADAATIAKVPIGEMGQVFNKVASSNKVQGDVINQLNDKGIPIVQLLGKEMGKTSAEVTDLSRKGKIDFKTFSKAMHKGMGGAAQASGKTTSGALKNLNASLGRIGANLLTGLGFGKVSGLVMGLTKHLGPLEDNATKVGKALHNIGAKVGPPVVAVFKDTATFVGRVTKFLWDYKAVLVAVVAGLAAYKVIQLAVNAAGWASYLWQSREVIIGAARIAITNAMTAAQKALNASMLGNPIGLVIVALVALVAIFIVAYKKSDTFKRIVNATWAAIKAGLAVAWAFIRPVFVALGQFLSKALPVAVNILKNVFKVVFFAIQVYVKVWWFAIRVIFAAFKTFLTKIVFPIIRFLYSNVFKPVFSKVVSVVKGAYYNGIKPVFTVLKSAIGKVKGAFTSAVGGIKSAWNGIKSAMATPVNWVIRNVINKLISAVNWVTKKIGGPTLKKVSEIGSGRKSSARDSWASKGGKGGRGSRRGGVGGKGKGGKGRAWPANTRALSNNYAGHSGLDIAAAGGSPIKAASNGIVEYAGWGRGYGQAIFVRGDDGLLQIYGHSSRVSTHAGAKVRAGQKIGEVGTTGNSTGNHLHFEIARNGPGAASNRAATLAWLGGAKMTGAKSAFNPLASLKNKIAGITGKGAPGPFGKMIGPGVANILKKAALKFITSPGKIAKGLFKKINPFGGQGNIKTNVYDTGGWLKPGHGGVNLSKKPEPVFTNQQWATLKRATAPTLSGNSGRTSGYDERPNNQVNISMPAAAGPKEFADEMLFALRRSENGGRYART